MRDMIRYNTRVCAVPFDTDSTARRGHIFSWPRNACNRSTLRLTHHQSQNLRRLNQRCLSRPHGIILVAAVLIIILVEVALFLVVGLPNVQK